MLNYKALVHSDDFGTEVICWVEVTGVPERFVDEAKRIDGENYSSDGFGVCIQYDRDNGEYFAVEDEPGFTILNEKSLAYYERLKEKGELIYIDTIPYEDFMLLGQVDMEKRFTDLDEQEQRNRL